jgi:methylglyoxal synthase
MLLRLADVYNIPLATNPKAGQYLLWGIEKEL